jgi:hypothetical protein
MAGLTPTTRTIRYLQAQGWLADEVERRITRVLKRDLFGIADVLAVRASVSFDEEAAPDLLLVQCTSKSNVSARVKKIAESELTPRLRECGVIIQVFGWPDGGKDGDPKIVDCS